MDNLPYDLSAQPPKMVYQLTPDHEKQIKPYFHRTWIYLLISIAIIPLNFFIWNCYMDADSAPKPDALSGIDKTATIFHGLFIFLAILQLIVGFAAMICAIKYATAKGRYQIPAILLGALGSLIGLGGPVAIVLDFIISKLSGSIFLGGAWGRPLRVKGKILHPELRLGSDWSAGAQPKIDELDEDTRRALEALWLHDAQKEHASVPAFSRISWQLIAVGAPANLVEAANRSAIQEIDHARRCFALAAGYGGRVHSVEPMPQLLKNGLDTDGDPMVAMAVESLQDGCLLEGYNADVAQECFEICQDVAVKDVLRRITREERQHADFSWSMLEWLLNNGGASVQRAIAKTITELKNVPRPTAVSSEKAPLVAKADPAKLRAHGRLEDSRWAQLWSERLTRTEQAAQAMLEACRAKNLSSDNVNNLQIPAPSSLVNRAAASSSVVRRF